MSIEFFATPEPLLDDRTMAAFLEELANTGWGLVVRRTDTELGLSTRNPGETPLETTTIQLRRDQVYIGFHSENGNDQDHLLAITHKIARDLGIAIELEEE